MTTIAHLKYNYPTNLESLSKLTQQGTGYIRYNDWTQKMGIVILSRQKIQIEVLYKSSQNLNDHGIAKTYFASYLQIDMNKYLTSSMTLSLCSHLELIPLITEMVFISESLQKP